MINKTKIRYSLFQLFSEWEKIRKYKKKKKLHFYKIYFKIRFNMAQFELGLEAHTYNPSYSEGRQEGAE